MSKSQVDEWLHADKGAPWKHAEGGAIGRALHVASDVAALKPKKLAVGGMSSFDMMRPPYMPIQTRAAIREDESSTYNRHPLGQIESTIPGRTDQIPASVAADSYVIPADVVSGLGEGNTMAGAKLIDMMFHSGPYGLREQGVREAGRPVGIPTARPPSNPYLQRELEDAPEQPWFAKGGKAKAKATAQRQPDGVEAPRQVPVVVAGGEYVVPPEIVKNHPKLGAGDMKHGHAVLDAFVRHARKKIIEEMKKLPGPQK
jgi:hypothetical protein